MLIDWFTMGVQIINFIVLVLLLNRFLFKPIRGAIARREKTLADALDRAEKAEQNARARIQELESEKQALADVRARLMDEARAQVARWREETVQKAWEEVEALRHTWMASMTRDRQRFLDGVKARMVRHVVRIGERALRDLADQQLNRQVMHIFLEKVAERKEELNHQALQQGLRIKSGLALDDADVRLLEERLAKCFPTVSGIRVESAPDLGLGIQLVAGDRRAAWHLADYLKDLEAEIMENLFTGSRGMP